MTNLFDEYKAVFEGKEVELKNVYMINRLLSFSKQGFQVAVDCNKFINRIPNDMLLKIYRSSISASKAPFIKYSKVPKISEPKLLSKMCRLFNCSRFHAKQIIIIYRKIGVKIEEKFGLKKGE